MRLGFETCVARRTCLYGDKGKCDAARRSRVSLMLVDERGQSDASCVALDMTDASRGAGGGVVGCVGRGCCVGLVMTAALGGDGSVTCVRQG